MNKASPLNDFTLSKTRFTARATEEIVLPEYKGSTFRGGFGHAFKDVNCVAEGENCDQCILQQDCLYNYVFNTPVPDDAKIMKKYPYAPHPFVIEPPEEKKREYESGEEFSFSLVLIGDVTAKLPFFIFAFEHLGELGLGRRRGSYELIKAESQNIDGDFITIYEDDTLDRKNITIAGSDIYQEELDQLKLELKTPLRLKFQESLVSNLHFHIVIRNLLRRISLLNFFHCGEELNVDFQSLIEKAKEVNKIQDKTNWYDWGRYSSRQKEWIKMGGLIGELTYQGTFTPYSKFLKLGQYIHIGKNTAFGMGKYNIYS